MVKIMKTKEQKYKHYIITRFNIAVKFSEGGEKVRCVDTCIDEAYLTKRFQLFEKYTFSTVSKQSNKNFRWIVLFSDRTPDKFRKIISDYQRRFANFQPEYLSAAEAFDLTNTLNRILKRVKTDWYVTTRLDNDDAISLNFMEEIQAFLNKNELYQSALYFDIGIQYDEDSNIACIYEYPDNHFFTLIYPDDEQIITSLAFNHKDIQKQLKATNLGGNKKNPMWIEIIHQTNYGNLIHQNLFTLIYNNKCFEKFDILVSWTKPELFKITFHILFLPIKRYYQICRRHGFWETVHRFKYKLFKG